MNRTNTRLSIDDKLRINEIFHSVQGESSYQGLPCVFIRFSGCNLRCRWCDTSYSYEEEGELMEPGAVLEQTRRFDCKLVEITGGEPLVQEKGLISLISLLLAEDYKVLLETNGSLSLKNIPSGVVKIVDYKLPGSGEFGSFLLENINFLDKNQDQIKFVVHDGEDLEAMKDFIVDFGDGIPQYLIASPTDFGFLPVMADFLMKRNLPVRLQVQLHKLIWNDERRK